MKQVRLMIHGDVAVARMHWALHGSRRTRGYIGAPIDRLRTGLRERRHCRSCGFPLGVGELIIAFSYSWPDEDWSSGVAVAIHEAGCRHGAAHDLVATGRSYRTRWAELDEVDAGLFGMHADGLSEAGIARRVGTTSASVARVLRTVAKRLRVASDRHARALAIELLKDDWSVAPTSVDDEIDALIRDVNR